MGRSLRRKRSSHPSFFSLSSILRGERRAAAAAAAVNWFLSCRKEREGKERRGKRRGRGERATTGVFNTCQGKRREGSKKEAGERKRHFRGKGEKKRAL